MRLTERVWRHIPASGHPLDTSFILKARGRWNRAGIYGCLYTALTQGTALAEFRKLIAAQGLEPQRMADWDLVSIDVDLEPVLDLRKPRVRSGIGIGHSAIRGDDDSSLEACRRVADRARQRNNVAILAPSAALRDGSVLAIYPDMHPASNIDLAAGPDRIPINYGSDPVIG